jgi:hypothetical protein
LDKFLEKLKGKTGTIAGSAWTGVQGGPMAQNLLNPQ